MKQQRLYVVDGCKSCPNRTEARTPGTGFGIDWRCKAVEDRKIRGYIEWPSEEPKDGEFPDWCPLPTVQ